MRARAENLLHKLAKMGACLFLADGVIQRYSGSVMNRWRVHHQKTSDKGIRWQAKDRKVTGKGGFTESEFYAELVVERGLSTGQMTK